MSNYFGSKTHSDITVRLDLVNPESILQDRACSVEQLLELTQSEWTNLWGKKNKKTKKKQPNIKSFKTWKNNNKSHCLQSQSWHQPNEVQRLDGSLTTCLPFGATCRPKSTNSFCISNPLKYFDLSHRSILATVFVKGVWTQRLTLILHC